MILEIINHSFAYEIKNICTMFFPFEKIREQGDDSIAVRAELSGGVIYITAKAFGKEINKNYELEQNEDVAIAMSVLLYKVFSELTGFIPPWGILFGVRPAKLMHRFSAQMGIDKTKEMLLNDYLVSKKKLSLAEEVMKHENEIIALSADNSFSLYVSIPFCPTRCSYCSFVSHSIERTHKLLEPYVELICKELERTGEIAKRLNLRLETVYFGGGTPTTLSAAQLTRLTDTISSNFDLSTVREYTVEAGRPDTVSEEKLIALKKAGVTRISINPQTFNDSVLNEIGRRHTSDMTISAFNLARKCGFDNINMDLIAGLPMDTLDSFKNSVNSAVQLGAESITVHTLAMKSSSYMVTEENDYDLSDRMLTSYMVDYSNERLSQAGYYPYYMYRQSKSLGNLENVGWCRQGRDCLYNVYMMDETHSVFGAGAGAVTRLKNQSTGHIERIYNLKYPYEYIDRFDEILNRKSGIISFYDE